MKKIVLSILSIGIFISSYGQTQGGGPGFEFGLRGAAASNWLFNSNVSQGGTQSLAPAFSYNYGLHVAYNFSSKIAIEVTPFFGIIKQGYSGKFTGTESLPSGPFVIDGESYTSNTQVNITGIPVLLRAGSGNGAYIEVGPEYDMVRSATFTVNYTSGPPGTTNGSSDVTPYFTSSNILAVLGFGDDFQIGSTGLNIVTCLRFYYGFTDLVGVDGHGQSLNQNNSALYTGDYNHTGAPYYSAYKPTHAAGASFSIGAYYYIPVTTSKGGRTACKHPPRVKD